MNDIQHGVTPQSLQLIPSSGGFNGHQIRLCIKLPEMEELSPELANMSHTLIETWV